MLPTLLAVVTVFVPAPPLSPEPLTHEPPAPLVQVVDHAWDQTHPDGYVPPALRPKPKPKPAATSKPSQGSGMGNGSVEQWRGLIEAHFPAEQVEMALCVVRGESGGSPTAQNPRSSAAGLFQFLRSTWDDMVPRSVTGGSYDSGAVFDPVAATRAAAWLWANLGWSQWSAASRC